MVRSVTRNMIATASVLLGTLVSMQPGAHAQTFNGFGPSFQYDQGLNPSVATSQSIVVEVHNGTAGAGPLWYRVGKVNGSTVTWSDSHQYDVGYNPSVALLGTAVVEVHNGGGSAGPLWYRVGKVNGSTIAWSDSHQYDTGYNPSVAVAGNPALAAAGIAVVEVHNGAAGVGPLWYRMGKLNGSSISWSDSHQFDSFSTNPSVGAYLCIKLVGNPVNPAACGVDVLEVHNSNASPGPLWYRYGHSNDGSTITWQKAVSYDSGWNPKISLSANTVFEVHNGQAGAGPMWYHLGTLQSPTLTFAPSVRYDNGNNPSVAVDAVGCPVAIEVHNGGAGLGPEWYHLGTYKCPIIQ